MMLQTLTCPPDHARVEIECMYALSTKDFEDCFGAYAASTSDLERHSALNGTAHLDEVRCYDAALYGGAHGIVHEEELEAVQ